MEGRCQGTGEDSWPGKSRAGEGVLTAGEEEELQRRGRKEPLGALPGKRAQSPTTYKILLISQSVSQCLLFSKPLISYMDNASVHKTISCPQSLGQESLRRVDEQATEAGR